MKTLILTLLTVTFFVQTNSSAQSPLINRYVDDLRSKGKTPFEFVSDLLSGSDLVIFDDGLHTA